MTVKIDKELLFEFLIIPSEEISKEHLDEAYKVIRIVLNKYQSKYYRLFEELESRIMQYFIERRERFNPQMCAYNYLFTIARNEAGNYINKYTREYPVDEFYGAAPSADADFKAEGVLGKYQDMLTGTGNGQNVLRISREDTILLLLEFANYNRSLNKIKREFTQREAKQLYILSKTLLAQ